MWGFIPKRKDFQIFKIWVEILVWIFIKKDFCEDFQHFVNIFQKLRNFGYSAVKKFFPTETNEKKRNKPNVTRLDFEKI